MVMMLTVEQMRLHKMFDCRRPFGAFVTGYGDPRADARGYLPSPLRGCGNTQKPDEPLFAAIFPRIEIRGCYA